MKELERTADPVRLSYLRAVLAEEGIESVVLDSVASTFLLGAVVPRLMVADEDFGRARWAIWGTREGNEA